MIAEVNIKVVKGCQCDDHEHCNDSDQAVISNHGRQVWLNPADTKRVRDELTKALRQFSKWNRKRVAK